MPSKFLSPQKAFEQINPELLSINTLKAVLKACQHLEQIFAIRAKELAYDNEELNLALQNLNQILTFKEKLLNIIERTTALQTLEQSKLKPLDEDTKITLELLNYIKENYNIHPKDLLLYILNKYSIEQLAKEIINSQLTLTHTHHPSQFTQ